LDQFVEIGLRGAWQNNGYFRVKLTAEAQSLGGNSNEEHFIVTAHVDEGVQYHLGDLRFIHEDQRGVPVVSESELQAAMPVKPGEILDVSRIRDGLEAL